MQITYWAKLSAASLSLVFPVTFSATAGETRVAPDAASEDVISPSGRPSKIIVQGNTLRLKVLGSQGKNDGAELVLTPPNSASVSRAATATEFNFVGERRNAVIVSYSYPSASPGMSYCGAGDEEFLTVAPTAANRRPTLELKLASCIQNIDLASPPTWDATNGLLKISWLEGPNGDQKPEEREYKVSNDGDVNLIYSSRTGEDFRVSAETHNEIIALTEDSSNWAMPLGNYSSQRYSKLKQINTSTAKNLHPVWTFSTGILRGHEGGPLVIGDTMYLSTPFPNKVFALDLNEGGRIIWSYEPRQDPNVIPVMCCDTVNRGVAYGRGMIFLHQADTTLVALDARTGKPVWAVKDGDSVGKGESGTSAPLVVKDKVLVGISGGEFGIQGRMTAYNIRDGSKAWSAFSSGPDDMIKFDPKKTTVFGKPVGENSSLKTWQGDQWKNGGGATWGWISYDPKLNLVYYGSGNPGTWNPSQRPGDNKWSMTIFARNPDTGEAKWVYQMTPHDQWDYDGVNEMILADLPVHGKMAHALVHFDRNGFAYVLDRANGKLLEAEKFDVSTNWASKIDMPSGRPVLVDQYGPGVQGEGHNTKGVCPAALGSKDEQPASYSPESHIFFVPTNHVCMDFEPFKVSYTAGQPFVGATLSMYPPSGESNLGNFIAYDANEGKVVWSDPEVFSVWSGALSTAGGIVAYGTLDGYLKVADQKSGKLLYKFKTPSGIIGNVNTFSHNGKQYLAVMSGVGGWAGIGMAAGLTEDNAGLGAVGAYKQLSNYTQLGGVLTVFGLSD